MGCVHMQRSYHEPDAFERTSMRNWISILAHATALGVGICLASLAGNFDAPLRGSVNGWAAPTVAQADPMIQSTIPEWWNGRGVGGTFLLYRDYQVVHGRPYPTRDQGAAPSCVGQAAAAAVDFLAATQARYNYEEERLPDAGASAAVIYGLSRQEIGGLSPWAGGGSHCLWSVKAIQQYGVVAMREYPAGNFSIPSASLCIKYGSEGASPALEAIARRHPVLEFIRIRTFENLRDAMYFGCPVVVGSSIGFGKRSGALRDKDGFLNRPGAPNKNRFFRRPWNPSIWNHAMVFIGVRDNGRKGALLLNSWGKWISGPKAFGDEPMGSFWTDAKVVNLMLSYNDAFAIYGFIGYPNYRIN